MKLQDKVAIVTGGSRGIGRSISLQLAEAGAHVVIASTTLEPALAVAEQIKASGRKALAIQTDVANRDSVKSAVSKTLEQFGRIDILVNNAGGSARGRMSRFCDSTEDVWDYVFDTNVKGVFYMCREVINPMLQQGSGCIINIGSVAGIIGLAGQVDYSASKGAVIAFTKALAKENAALGVRVNCVSPGPTISDAGRSISAETRAKFAKNSLAQSTGFGHFAEPDDIASLVAFLASDDAKFITGQNYPVCGVMNLGFAESIVG